jgi:hypothetical protein
MRDRPTDPLTLLLQSAVTKAEDAAVKRWLEGLLTRGEPASTKPPAKQTPQGAKAS